MGTRNLTAVFVDGEYKVAQYGQWDGYPDGAGLVVLEFARWLAIGDNMDEFKNKVRACSWITEAEIKEIGIPSGMIPYNVYMEWQRKYPCLGRDLGPGVLNYIEINGGQKLRNEISFAADSLFCEWAWVIDLDKKTFEGYEGFNERELAQEDRFYSLESMARDGYHPVKKVVEFDLLALPSEEEFLSNFEEKED